MTREEAIEILEANRPDPCYQMLREAVDFAVDALKAQDVPDTNVGDNGDTIYRQAAIDAINSIMPTREGLYEPSDVLCELMQLPSVQNDLQQTCNKLATDCISRQAAIDIVVFECGEWTGLAKEISKQLSQLPSAQPEIIWCKDCRKHNVSVGYKEDCCALFEWRGVSYGHEHDYQYCCHAERRTDE